MIKTGYLWVTWFFIFMVNQGKNMSVIPAVAGIMS